MGFFVNNVYSGRQPYRVQEIQKDKPSDQDSKQQFFDQNQDDAQQKFLKASEKLYRKKSVVLASEIMNKQMMKLEGGLS
ncbi:MAG: hypothetical protein KDK64_06930, partial [Chlamydiia bacterium]|nr:hypothetical protein [Chlamydiia bacterium]